MNELNFTYWLQGFFELTDSNVLTEEQVEVIKEHLSLVFTKKTETSVRDRAKAHGIDVTKGSNQDYINSITGKRMGYPDPPKKVSSDADNLPPFFDNFMVWDGKVILVEDKYFNAVLINKLSLVEELISIGKDELSEEDLTLLNKGAVFSFVIDRELDMDGNTLRASTIKFRPQHFWTKKEIDQIAVEASKYDSFFDLDDDNVQVQSNSVATVSC